MKKQPLSANKELNKLRVQIQNLWPAAKGSVAEVAKPCIRPHCKACREGRKHRAFIFSYNDGACRRCLYVPARLVKALRRAIANGRHVERLLRQAGVEMILSQRRRR